MLFRQWAQIAAVNDVSLGATAAISEGAATARGASSFGGGGQATQGTLPRVTARRPPFEGAAPRKGVAPPAPETQDFGDGSRAIQGIRLWNGSPLPPSEKAAPREGVALRLGIWRLSDMRQNAVEFVEGIVFDHQPTLAFGIVVEADLGAQRFR